MDPNRTNSTVNVKVDIQTKEAIPTQHIVKREQSSWKINKHKSLKQRSKVPSSFYLTVVLVLAQSYASGILNFPASTTICTAVYGSFHYSFQILSTCNYSIIYFWFTQQGGHSMIEYAKLLGLAFAIVSSFKILFVAPFKAGMWTGERAKRHVIHRYMGLLFLIQYSLAWVEFTSNYEVYKLSYLPFTIALNGKVIFLCHILSCGSISLIFFLLNSTQ